MNETKAFYVDHSTLSTLSVCREKARLSYVEGYQPKLVAPSLSLGKSIHAGVDALYSTGDIQKAIEAFVKEASTEGANLPLEAEGTGPKRSIDRGVAILEAYASKYKDEPFENVVRPDTGKPYIEISGLVYLMDWRGLDYLLHDVFYFGKIDRIRKSKVDGRLYNFETKTTSGSLSMLGETVRPNHQITGYHFISSQLLKVDLAGTYLDGVFISSRQESKACPTGVDVDKDFSRFFTDRSQTDIEEWLFDTRELAREYLDWQASEHKRWPRSAPTACSMYGGCAFRSVCGTNGNQALLDSQFIVKPWRPWEGKK